MCILLTQHLTSELNPSVPFFTITKELFVKGRGHAIVVFTHGEPRSFLYHTITSLYTGMWYVQTVEYSAPISDHPVAVALVCTPVSGPLQVLSRMHPRSTPRQTST